MPTIDELKTQRSAAITSAETIRDAAGTDWTDSEIDQISDLVDQADALTKEIEELESYDAARKELQGGLESRLDEYGRIV